MSYHYHHHHAYRGCTLQRPPLPNLSESIVSWMPPLVTHREEQAPMGACSRLTAWKCPRGGLDARRRAGWKIGCGGAVGNAIGPCRDTGALRGTGRKSRPACL